MRLTRSILMTLLVMGAALATPRALADPQTPATERISGDGGIPEVYETGFATLGRPALSANGRLVAWMTIAKEVPEDVNGASDIYVRDRLTQTTSLVSVSSSEEVGNAGSFAHTLSMTPDGRYVVFFSEATNLVAADTNGVWDVFRRDLVTGTTEMVSLSKDGRPANGWSFGASISHDGSKVAFASDATDLTDKNDLNNRTDVFLRDLSTDTNEIVSVTTSGVQGRGDSPGFAFNHVDAAISGDGRFVAFASYARNLWGATGGVAPQVLLRDTEADTTVLASRDIFDTGPNNGSGVPSLSYDGRYVAFKSEGSDLVLGDTNRSADVFVFDRVTEEVTLESVSSLGVQGDHDSFEPMISADGKFIAFSSKAYTLIPVDLQPVQSFTTLTIAGQEVLFPCMEVSTDARTGSCSDIFVRDRVAGTISLISMRANDTASDNESFMPAISPDGSYVAFASSAWELTYPHETETDFDVFLRDLTRGSCDSGANERGPISGKVHSLELGSGEVHRMNCDALVPQGL